MGRYRDDVDVWKQDHDSLARDCWLWEDLVAKANFVFQRIILLDQDVREAELAGQLEATQSFADLESMVEELMRNWVEVSAEIEPQVKQLTVDLEMRTVVRSS